ncbi:MAG: hypothetical protein JXA66_03345 [Oligoflexia bacterium]|nr:hypothetical protein [Oligoflexia bacterium]
MLKNKGLTSSATAVILVLFFCTSVLSATAEDYFNYGTKAYLNGNYGNALKYYGKCVKLDARNPKYYSAIGDCYKEMGSIEKAMLYYDYAEKLGGTGEEEDFYQKREKETRKRANLIATNPTVLFSGIVNLYYERRITDFISAGVDFGYIWATSVLSFVSGGSSVSGFGYSAGVKANFFFENKALTGAFAGPELYYYNAGITVVATDEYGDPTVSKTELSLITAGGHIGYRLIMEGGLSIDGVVSILYIKSSPIDFGGSSITLNMVLPMMGAYAGYAF